MPVPRSRRGSRPVSPSSGARTARSSTTSSRSGTAGPTRQGARCARIRQLSKPACAGRLRRYEPGSGLRRARTVNYSRRRRPRQHRQPDSPSAGRRCRRVARHPYRRRSIRRVEPRPPADLREPRRPAQGEGAGARVANASRARSGRYARMSGRCRAAWQAARLRDPRVRRLRSARQSINRIAFRLGVPSIDAGLDRAGSVRARVYVPGMGDCLECSWGARDYELLEQRVR